MSDTALEVYNGTQISLHRPPKAILDEATEAANALTTVLKNKPNKVMFNGEQYLEREDWGTVAKFYGCTAKVVETRYLQFGDVTGWEATAVCIDRNLNEIGRAESMCLSDEDNWGAVPVYEWEDDLNSKGEKQYITYRGEQKVKRRKVQVATKPKPQFQLRSMAQTRAEAKALKSVFGWVVVLAGFKTTPAEEMTGDEQPRDDADDQREQVQQPTRESQKQAEPELITVTGTIETAKLGKEGSVWFLVDKKIVAVKADLSKETMAVGGKLSVKAIKKGGQQEYFWTVEVLESTAPPEGYQPPPAAASEEKQADFVGQMDPDSQAQGLNLGQMMDDASAKKEPETENSSTGKKVIGVARRQRLFALITSNKDKNNGFNSDLLRKIVKKEPFNLEHISDLPVEVYGQFEKLCTGEMDWREALEESER